MTPEILSLSAFARFQGCRPSYVTKLKAEGRLVLTAGGKVVVGETLALIEQTRGGRPDVAARHDAQRVAGSEKKISEGQSKGSGEKAPKTPRSEGEERLVDAKLRKESAQADQEEMKAKQMAGNLISREDVEAAMKFIGGAVRAALEVFPDQTAPLVAPINDLAEVNEVLTQACRDALHSVGDAIDRQKKELEKVAA